MADVPDQLFAGKYLAVKRPRYSTEVVTPDGGVSVHNSRWSGQLAQWDVTIPACRRTSPQYLAAVTLFDAVLGSGLTFSFHDPVDCVDVDVFILDDTMTITPDGSLLRVEFAVEAARPSGAAS